MSSTLARLITRSVVVILVMLSTWTYALADLNPTNPKYGGTLVVAIPADPPHLNGAVSTSNLVNMVTSAMQDSLVIQDRDGKSIPSLAESWEASEGGKTWTFKLVKNAKWHDGQPFTSADVKYTAEKIWKVTHSRNSQVFRTLTEIDTPDTSTVVFKFSQPNAGLLASLGQYEAAVAPKHVFDDGTTFATGHPRNTTDPIGTGPFKFQEWVKGDHVTFVKNPDYWRSGQPYLDRVIFKVIPDGAGRALALEAGEVDLIQATSLPTFAEINRLRNVPGVQVNDATTFSIPVVMGLMFNLDRAPMNKLEFRQAFAHTINRQFLVDNVVQGLGAVADGPFRPPWFDDAAVVKYPVDIAKANALLDQAGLPRGADGTRISVKLGFDQSRANAAKAVDVIREQMRQVGVDVVLSPMDSGTMEQTLFIQRDFDIAVPAEFLGIGPDPTVGIRAYMHSASIGTGLYNNAPNWKNPVFDKALDDAAAEPDIAKRKAYFSIAQHEATKELPWVWLMEAYRPTLQRDRFVNVDWSDAYQVALSAVHLKSDPAATSAAGTSTAEPAPSNTAAVVGVGLLAILAVGGVFLLRRRRT